LFLKKFKPTSNGVRHRLRNCSFNLTDLKLKNLIIGFNKNSGRNNKGGITVRHKRGANHNYYCVDFNRTLVSQSSICIYTMKISSRTAYISLIIYACGSYSYILAPHGVVNGYSIHSLLLPEHLTIKYNIGFMVFLKFLKFKSIFFNVNKYARSAGTYCVLMIKNEDTFMIKVRLPSKKKIFLDPNILVCLGRASNILKKKEIVGKAGKNFLKGKRPSVRGVAMNPVDHPHGGRTKTNSPELTP